MKDSRIPLIYIASNGRSGSTILDMTLGATPQLFSLGEFQNLYWEIKKPNKRCACGKEILECSFWKEIIERHREKIENGMIRFFRKNDRGKVLRWNLIRFLFFKNRKSLDFQKIKQYGKDNYHVLSSVLEKAQKLKGTEIQYLVDSSKDLYRLLWLKLSGRFKVKVIHLYKEPKGFVYSMIKKGGGFIV